MNQDLENNAVDIPKVFGANSPEAQQLAADTDSFKDAETADYAGIAVHCAQGSAFCSSAQGVKFGQTTPTPTAVTDSLPDEPGGYTGYQGLFGHRYVAPQLGAGTANLSHHGYQVTNAAGNLVDENGNQINGAFLTNHPGFPGFGPHQRLADAGLCGGHAGGRAPGHQRVHRGHPRQRAHPRPRRLQRRAGRARQRRARATSPRRSTTTRRSRTFFKRLAADGITPKNSLFILSPDEGDHEAGANVGRAIQPTPANCDGATVSGDTVTPDVPCTYPAGSFGELAGNVTGLLATQKSDTTPFTLENDTAPEFYVTGKPGPDDARGADARTRRGRRSPQRTPTPGTPTRRSPTTSRTRWRRAILHMVNADPARTPTFAMFAKPDYFLSSGSAACTAPCVTQNTGFAWDHGDYAAEIDTNWLGIAGPGVAHLGLDGSGRRCGPEFRGRQQRPDHRAGQRHHRNLDGSRPTSGRP